ncbi:hypothetical protein [Ectothiorhodospira marina]|jgi:hypothetical protein|uniref:DUF7931 domain-containing protein n=1 Tax=Ectothiorhodospira marina TaxID=1396821 RepID=A0A1H7F827_9GAMM|nr:hypothetical protein [Ectothiorhodospira marina]SEK20522.1 hypothetical protein SAMN05444515_10199 [Ectothiorhodospira marina]
MYATSAQPLMEHPEHYLLGRTDSDITLDAPEHLRLAVQRMVEQARRSLWLTSRHLDPAIFDDPAVVEPLSRLARHSRHVDIRILIQDSDPLRGTSHRLIHLAQRLSSRVHVRRMGEPDRRSVVEAFLIADRQGLIHQPQALRYQAVANFHTPRRSRLMGEQFMTHWDAGEPDPHLRRLHL